MSGKRVAVEADDISRARDVRQKPKAGGVVDVKAASVVAYCRSSGWPEPVAEYEFHRDRRWRFDLAWPTLKLALEFEGLCGAGGGMGRHQRVAGYRADCEKYSEALCLGWRVLRVTSGQVKSGQVYDWLDRLIAGSRGGGTASPSR